MYHNSKKPLHTLLFIPLPISLTALTVPTTTPILDTRMVKYGDTTITQVLIHYANIALSEATWDFAK